jgi:hypothetical protein
MRLVQVKDLLDIERDGEVKRGTGAYYLVLLTKVITELGTAKMINRKMLEQLNSADFAFLIDLLHEINHQVIKRAPLVCAACGRRYWGTMTQLGEV